MGDLAMSGNPERARGHTNSIEGMASTLLLFRYALRCRWPKRCSQPANRHGVGFLLNAVHDAANLHMYAKPCRRTCVRACVHR